MNQLTVLSHRLPVRLERGGRGRMRLEPSAGGLVTALDLLLRRRGGAWVGWPGVPGPLSAAERAALEAYGREAGYRIVPVPLSGAEVEGYYHGACNRVLWPLLHGFSERVHHTPSDARHYDEANARFARAAADLGGPTIWVHDYHLMRAGERMRRALPTARLGFFLHVPFPGGDVMEQLSWRPDLRASLAAFDLLGFQSDLDRDAFHAWLRVPARRARRAGEAPSGAEPDAPSPEIRTGVFPAAPDYRAFHEDAREAAVAARAGEIRREMGGRRILLAVDRLDYTKGIPHRLRAFARLLETEPDLRGRVVLDQLVAPSREAVPDYGRLRSEVEGLVARINGAFGRGGWMPVRYVYGTRDRQELLAWYVAADVAVVTPLRDGMGLVAKEYCAANPGSGALLLSRFAGAAAELADGAVVVNPWDPEDIARGLRATLALGPEERSRRMARLRRRLRSWDTHTWGEAFLQALGGARRVGVAGGRRPRLRALSGWSRPPHPRIREGSPPPSDAD